MLLGTLDASLLGNLLTRQGTIAAGEGTIGAGQDFLMQPHPLTNFELQKYYQNEPKFNGVYSGNNLTKIKDGTYAIKFDEFKSIVTRWISLYIDNYNVTYFDSFGVEHIPKEMKKLIRNKNVTNIYRIQPYNSIICRYICIGFIDLMSKGLLEYTNLFSLMIKRRIIK